MKMKTFGRLIRSSAVYWFAAFVVTTATLLITSISNASAYLLVGGYTSSSPFERRFDILRFDERTGTFVDVFIPNVYASTIAYGPEGNLYLSDGNRYDAHTGALIGHFFPGGDFAFGPDGNLYGGGCTVVPCFSGGIQRYDGASGQLIDTFISTIPGSSHGGIAFGPDGNFYVASHGPGLTWAILRYDVTTGALLDTFVDPLRSLFPQHGMMFGPDGKLYVATETPAILRLDPTTGLFDAIRGGQETQAVAFGPDGNLYVGNAGTGGCGIFRTDLESGSFSGFAGCTDASPLRDTFALAFTPVPGPGSLMLVAVGAMAVMIWRQTRRLRAALLTRR